MKTIMLYNNAIPWFNLFPELNLFEPVVNQCPEAECLSETPFGYKIEYSVPGMKKRDLKMRIDNNNLVLDGHQKEYDFKLPGKNSNITGSSFIRTILLTEDMDIERLKAA